MKNKGDTHFTISRNTQIHFPEQERNSCQQALPIQRFFKLGSGEYYQEFTTWLHSEEDKEIKANAYRDTYIKVVGIRPEDLVVNLNP